MKNEFRIKSPTQACRVIEQILKTCTNSTITIKTNNNTETTTTTIATSSSNNNNKRSNSISSSSMNTTSSSVNTSADEEDDSQCSFDSSTYVDNPLERQKHGGKTKRVKYGPIQVKPRDKAAPTLATGRKSKDYEVCVNFCHSL